MTDSIRPDGSRAEAGRIAVRAPGLSGSIEPLAVTQPTGVRTATTDADLDRVLAAHGLRPMDVAYLDATVVQTEALRAREGTRAAGTTEDPGIVTVEVADPGEGWEQVLLVRDDVTGTLSWAFPVSAERATGTLRDSAGGVRRYELAVTGRAPLADGRRGVVGTVVKKLIKVLAFKVADAAIGAAASFFARRWEEANRRNALLAVGDGLGAAGLRVATDADWGRARDGRALLFLHGTFSNTEGFAGLPAPTLGALHDRYPGGIFAFDHFTVSQTPLDNVRWLLDNLPRGIHLDVDVVCHSRGGLVGRVLAENHPDGSFDLSPVTVHRGVFVATPHAGTPLADTERMAAFVDTYTNLFTLLPDHPLTDGLAIAIEAIKDIAAVGADALGGLQAMNPSKSFLGGLNVELPPGDARYFAIAANYEPRDQGLRLWGLDRIADAAFRSFQNDLVVPTAGAYDANGSSRFPITEKFVFPTDGGIHHCNYFANADVSARLLEWLTPAG